MAPYYIIFAVLAALALCDAFEVKRAQRRGALLIVTVVLILFAGLRRDLPDYNSYVSMFDSVVQTGNWMMSSDAGYSLLNGLVAIFTSQSAYLFLLVAFFAVTLNVVSFSDYTRFAFAAVLFYFVHNYALKEMIQIRAGLACAISLYNVRNIGQRREWRFWILQVVAMSIHLGAVFFLLAYLVKKVNFAPRTWWWILGASFAVGMVAPLGAWFKSLPGMELLSRAQTYNEWGDYASTLGILTNMATLKQLAMSMICLLYWKPLSERVRYFDVLAGAYFVSTCWLMLWNDFAIVAARVATFLSIGEPVLMASLLWLVTPRSRVAMTVLLIAAAALFLYTNTGFSKVMPYHWVL